MPNTTKSTALATTTSNKSLVAPSTTVATVAPATQVAYSYPSVANTSKRAWSPKANTVPGVYVQLLQAAGSAGVPFATMAAAIAACPTAKAHSVQPLAKWLAANRGIGSSCANGIIKLL